MHVLVTCKYKKDRIKTTEKRWRHIFPIIRQWGFSVAMETRVLIQSAPKPYAAFLHPNDATYKIWSRLVNCFQRYSSSKVWNFRHSRASNSKMSGLIRPKIELDRAFMPVLFTSNFDDDSIKNERASIETTFSHYMSMGKFLDAQGS